MKLINRALLICWLSMITILSLDLVTTIIGVEILGAIEQNKFASQLFNLGLFGYPLVLVFYAIFFICFLLLVGILYRFSYKGITNREILRVRYQRIV